MQNLGTHHCLYQEIAYFAFKRLSYLQSKSSENCISILDTGDVVVEFPSAKNYNFAEAKKSYIAHCPNAKYNIALLFSNYIAL